MLGEARMKKGTAIFSMTFIGLVLSVNGCDHAEHETAPEPARTPSPMVTPTITPEISPTSAPSPGDSAWLADGATHSVAGITSAPKNVIGKTVTVVAKVENVFDSRAFELDGGLTSSGSEIKDLLVLVPKVGAFENIDEQWKNGRARVTGVIHLMAPNNVEREIGWELPRSLENKFKGAPVLIARSVERLDN
jgi:hypothetical protein